MAILAAHADFGSVLPIVVQRGLQKLAGDRQFKLPPVIGRELVPQERPEDEGLSLHPGSGEPAFDGRDIDHLVLVSVLEGDAELQIIPNLLLYLRFGDGRVLSIHTDIMPVTAIVARK